MSLVTTHTRTAASMIILSHPNGNRNVRAVLNALHGEGKLYSFYTALGLAQDDWILRLAPPKIRRQLQRRTYDLPRQVMRRYPLREVTRLSAPSLKMASLSRSPNAWASIESVYTHLDETLAGQLSALLDKSTKAGKTVRGVYCYQDGALETFQAARKAGLKCFYDLPTSYYDVVEKMLAEEGERWPEWKFSMQSSLSSPAKLERHRLEIESAHAVYVPSKFVYDTIPQAIHQAKEVCVAEFGSPSASRPLSRRKDDLRAPLQVLFVGGMNQRKGLADLFAAMQLLNRKDVELVVLGKPAAPIEKYKSFYSGFRYEPPRPHAEVLALMAQCDVFVFPSIVEGRALVQQEALSQGLPLIVTRNAGAEDLIDEGKTGFLIPIRAPEAIAERINWFADNRAALPEMREFARRKAAEYTWQRYGKIIAESILSQISK